MNTQSFYTPTNCELHRHLYPLSPFIHLPPFSHRFLSQKSRRSSQYRPKYQKIVLFSKHCRALFGFSLMLLHLCMKVDTDICNSYLSSYNDLRSHTDVRNTDRSWCRSDDLKPDKRTLYMIITHELFFLLWSSQNYLCRFGGRCSDKCPDR